ncbi:MAG: hypothetical protein JSU03_09150 [Bacteroidetes bacterium]|nr:hypothetical protein [Bacteroidota bacterium]MBS1757431.1 hypothetical protein [Bacteroidota bacterium]
MSFIKKENDRSINDAQRWVAGLIALVEAAPERSGGIANNRTDAEANTYARLHFFLSFSFLISIMIYQFFNSYICALKPFLCKEIQPYLT